MCVVLLFTLSHTVTVNEPHVKKKNTRRTASSAGNEAPRKRLESPFLSFTDGQDIKFISKCFHGSLDP